MSTGYDDFLDILKKFRMLSVVALSTGAAVFAYVAQIAPPWPPGVMLLTALTELAFVFLSSLIGAFLVFQTKRRAEPGAAGGRARPEFSE
jgi:hypothetical protein